VEQDEPVMTAEDFVVSLRIRHPNIDPEEITQALGLEPQHCWKAGETRRTIQGEPLEGAYRESYWTGLFFETGAAPLGLVGDEALLAQAAQQLRRLQPFLRRLQQEGGTVELLVEMATAPEFSFSLSPRLLSMLASAGVSLLLDVRPRPQTAVRRLAG
jgi:hypothetical protein